MRLLAFSLGMALAISALAEVRPLSSKDVSLMLRAGFSSATVLHEIEQRRMVDAPDPTMTKSLGEFGASAQLLAALASGEFRVDQAEAKRAEEQKATASARQEKNVEKTFRDATEIVKKQRALAPAAAAPALGGQLAKGLQGKLVRCRDGVISAADASALDSKKLVAFYFSAHWCPPCRKFTPQLVDYYNRVAAEHPEFELIFVSYDKSRFNWETYMRDTKMPWLAIDYDQLSAFDNLKQLGGDSIPSLLVLNQDGRVVASSYAGKKYLGPQNALAALDQIFAAPNVAQTR